MRHTLHFLMSRFPARPLVFLPPLVLSFFCGCSSLIMRSDWEDAKSARDTTGWRSSLSSLGEGGASICVRNNAWRLRLFFVTTDPTLREQIAGGGMFFWFDPYAGETRSFGIRFPVAWSQVRAPANGTAGNNSDPVLGKLVDQLEVYTEGLNRHERVSMKDAGGLSAWLRQMGDTLMCEVTVPLMHGPRSPFAIGTEPGGYIGIGFETRNTRVFGRPSTASAADPRRGRGTLKGDGSGRNSAPGSDPPFNVWTKVQLSSR